MGRGILSLTLRSIPVNYSMTILVFILRVYQNFYEMLAKQMPAGGWQIFIGVPMIREGASQDLKTAFGYDLANKRSEELHFLDKSDFV